MKKIINTDQAPRAIGPYNQATEALGTYYLSGQIGLDPESMTFTSDTVKGQSEQIFKNIKAVLHTCGLSLDDVVKASVFLTSMDHFAEMNEVYAKYFEKNQPARECVAVHQLPANALVEISVIATKT